MFYDLSANIPNNPNNPNNPNIVQYNLINNYINYFQNTVDYLENCNTILRRLNTNMFNTQTHNYNNQNYNNQNYNNENDNNNYNNENDNRNDISQVIIMSINPYERLTTIPYRLLMSGRRTNNTSDNMLEYYRQLSNNNIHNIIINNIEKVQYGDIVSPLNNQCGITQEDFLENNEVAIIKSCKHIFTYHNFVHWAFHNLTCPNCRYNLLNNQNLIKYSESDSTDFYIFTSSELNDFINFRLY